jgi:hypothetical protein
MGKIIRLTENDLVRLVKKVINEQTSKEKEFINKIRSRFLAKGYKESNYKMEYLLLAMEKGKGNNISIWNDGPNKLLLELTKAIINPNTKKYEFSSIKIHVDNYDESLQGGGPSYKYKVDYYGDNGQLIKSDSLDGFQFGQLLDNYK